MFDLEIALHQLGLDQKCDGVGVLLVDLVLV